MEDSGAEETVVDLSRLEFIDPSGMVALAEAERRFRADGRSLHLLGEPRRFARQVNKPRERAEPRSRIIARSARSIRSSSESPGVEALDARPGTIIQGGQGFELRGPSTQISGVMSDALPVLETFG